MPPEGDHASLLDSSKRPAGETCLPPIASLHNEKETSLPAFQRESRKKSHQPSEPGRGGDPRAAGAPQQARISPAAREDARRLAPCGERQTGNTTCDSEALRHTGKGSTGVVGGVEGLAPLTPCPSPGGDPARMPGNSRQKVAEIKSKERKKRCRREATTPECRAEAASRRPPQKRRRPLPIQGSSRHPATNGRKKTTTRRHAAGSRRPAA